MIRFFLIILLPLLVACGGGQGYSIEFEIEGLGNKGVEMLTTDGRGVSRQQLHPVDGRFTVTGEAPAAQLAEFYTLDGRLLFSSVVRDGMRLKVSLDPDRNMETLHVEGDPDMELYASWLADNALIFTAGDDATVNQVVRDLVDTHRDSKAAALLMVTQFRTFGHELRADSIFNLIRPEARPVGLTASWTAAVGRQSNPEARRPLLRMSLPVARDTTILYIPQNQSYTVLAFTDSRKPDSILRRLRSLRRDLPARRLQILEISCARDSGTWRGYIAADSARWAQAWVAGGPAASTLSRIAVPRTPYYIVADSLGRQLYRGMSLFAADTLVRSLLGHPAPDVADADTTVHENIVDETPVPPVDHPRRPSTDHPVDPGVMQIKRAS